MKRRIGFVLLAWFSALLFSVAQETSPSPDAHSTSSNSPTVSGGGKTDYVPIWLSSSKLGNSKVFQSKTGNIGIGTTTPAANLDVNGSVNAAAGYNLSSQPFAFGSYDNENAFFGFAGNTSMYGTGNEGSGYQALYSNTGGIFNTADGFAALSANTTGGYNVAIGNSALAANTTGSDNAASGSNALGSNTTGYWNTASGYVALYYNTTGYSNVASGGGALYYNTTGTENTGAGVEALYSNSTGSDLTCIGYNCNVGKDGLSNATAIGAHAFVGQSNSLVLGGTGKWSVKVGIGTATPSSILTVARGAGHPVSDSWETYSSRRWKTNIKTLPDALSKVEQLRGVSYDLKDSGKHEIGVIAEEVGKVVPEIVTYEDNGKDARGVDYSRLTALLIEAVKQQQQEISTLRSQLQRRAEGGSAGIEAGTARIRPR